MSANPSKSPLSWGTSPGIPILLGVIVAGVIIVAVQHWMHFGFWLPYVLIFLACPVMMYFMMRGMNGPESRS